MNTVISAAVVIALAAQTASLTSARVPVLVELFTSEGCSSCPAADAHLARLQREQPVAGAEVIPIALHVDYFDHAGWKDAFSSPAFSDRQHDYSRIFGADSVYTPQIVVNGRDAVVGTENTLVDQAIASAARRGPLPLEVVAQQTGDRLQLQITAPAAPRGGEEIAILAAITQDGLSSDVTRGENSGRRLHHVAVARTLARIDVLGSNTRVIKHSIPIRRAWGDSGLKAVVWLQGRKSRQVYGADITAVGT
jgi:hypothetical protein